MPDQTTDKSPHFVLQNTSEARPFTAHAPKGVMLDEDHRIAAHAREIYLQSGRSHAMPPGNVTDITADERKAIVAWYEAATNASSP